jgi:hypothetical protein
VNRPDVIVRTNTEYYDQPTIYDQAPARNRMTLAQLAEVLNGAPRKPDEAVAGELNRIELTERMSSADLARWTAQMPGARSRTALTVMADESVFMKPAQETIVQEAAPEVEAQKQIVAKAIDYLAKAVSKLPDFFATRTTVRFEEPRQKDQETWKTVVGDQTLHLADINRVTMHIRNGKEVADASSKKNRGGHGRERDLVTEGTFGPILSTVIVGAAAPHSQLRWRRWEQGPRSREAVFSYVVPDETPLFEVGFCCLADPDGTVYFDRRGGFHGEIAIDPDTGAILRIAVEAELKPRLPIDRSGIMVEYGPVDIGGKEYICPMRSVSISRSRTVRVLHQWNESFGVYGPFETMVNDVTFSDYHIFRSTSRILVGTDSK